MNHQFNKVANTLDKDVKTEFRSTEEMVAGIKRVNQETFKNLVTFSTDVTAAYPNRKASTCCWCWARRRWPSRASGPSVPLQEGHSWV